MRRAAFVVAPVVAAFAACGTNPSGPTQAPASTSPKNLAVTALKISGPATIAPGESAQFTASAIMNDQSTQDYTTKVKWAAYSPAILSISSTGVATGQSNGNANVQATIAGFFANADIMVMPKGTYRLTGTVTESGLAVWNARVGVVSGTGAGLSAFTGSDGIYQLYGVAGNVELEVTDLGYVPLRKSIVVTANDVLDFPEFTQINSQPALNGLFQLTVQASNDCAARLFPEDRIRVYSAAITQSGPGLRINLTGASFFNHDGYGNYFNGRFIPSYLLFTIGGPYYYALQGPDVTELVAPDRVLSIDGFVEVAYPAADNSSPSSGIRTLFQGDIDEWHLINGSLSGALAFCHSQTHLFTLTPAAAPARHRTAR